MIREVRRHEIKFLLPQEQKTLFFDHIKNNGLLSRPIPYPSRWINSIYYESPFFPFDINDNETHVKHRLRWYGKNGPKPNEVLLEQKFNHDDISIKVTHQHRNLNLERIWINQHLYLPRAFVRYHRSYFLIDNDIRMTIDCSLTFSKNLKSSSCHNSNVVVVELKGNPGTNFDLSLLPLKKTKYSKFYHALQTI